MSLIYITGVAGTGKSTVRSELKRRGFKAYDTDEDGLGAFYNNKTGILVGSEFPAEVRTEQWRQEHTWKMPREVVEKLAQRAEDKPVFLCGAVANESEFLELFSHVFALVITEEVLVRRLKDRPNNDFGKSDHERRDVLLWQRGAAEDYRRSGAVLIDAIRPINMIVDDILEMSDITR